MALHGKIVVNQEEVGWWEARRIDHLAGVLNVYECSVHDKRGTALFRLGHAYENGAMALAHKVLFMGDKLLNEQASDDQP